MDNMVAQKAAKWWADQLRSPAKLDNGDDSETGAMTFMLAMMTQGAERSQLDSTKIDKFESILTEFIEENEPRNISVDYHPDYILSTTAERAGIDPGMTKFPWKTTMYFSGEKITVKEGYGAAAVEI